MKKCPNCNEKIESWKGRTPMLKIPCIYYFCMNCGAVPFPRIDYNKVTLNINATGNGILSFKNK